MLKASEILLETIKKDGRPERLLRQYEGATFYPKPSPWYGAYEGSFRD